MITDNARDRFREAVGILVDEQGRIKDRLMVAYVSQLSRVDPDQELPEHLAIEFDTLRYALTNDVVIGDRGNVAKELKSMSDEEASQMARQIFEMFLELWEIKGVRHETGTR